MGWVGTRNVIAHGVTEVLLDLVRDGRRDVAGRHRGGELVNGHTSRAAATIRWWMRV